MTKEELIKYWLDSSEENYASMRNVFNSGEFAWALFIGHLCIVCHCGSEVHEGSVA